MSSIYDRYVTSYGAYTENPDSYWRATDDTQCPYQSVTTFLATYGDIRRVITAYIAVDGHELLLKISGHILLWVPHDMSTMFSAK